jgi:hypothetical protein
MSYAQAELTSIWQKLTDDPERDEYGELDVSEMVQGFDLLKARVLTDTDTEQAIVFARSVDEVGTYADSDPPSDESVGVSYARLRDSKEGQWGVWKKAQRRQRPAISLA